MANTHRKTVRVDDRSRVTLGKLVEPGETYAADKRPNGEIVLIPMTLVPRPS